MSTIVFINHQPKSDADQCSVSDILESPAFNYGYGIFETTRIIDGNIAFFPQHYQRFSSSLDKLGYQLGFSDVELFTLCQNAIKERNVKTGVLRYSYHRLSHHNALLNVVAMETDVNPKEFYKVRIADLLKNHNGVLTSLKSNNYMLNHMAHHRAVAEGFDEAMFLNNRKNITECTRGNIFFIQQNNCVVTPASSDGVLMGVMRDQVLEFLRNSDKYSVTETTIASTQLKDFKACFMTNSVRYIMPVRKLNNQSYDDTHELIQELSNHFANKY